MRHPWFESLRDLLSIHDDKLESAVEENLRATEEHTQVSRSIIETPGIRRRARVARELAAQALKQIEQGPN